MTAILYVCRNGENAELRYSLRSLANLPHGDVWTAGGAPAWLTGVHHIPVPQTGTKFACAARNLLAFCNDPDTPGHFLLFNDDFFIMQPASISMVHLGPLQDTIDRYARTCASTYWQAAKTTQTLLKDAGIDHPLSYEAHTPMLLTKSTVRHAYKTAEPYRMQHVPVRTLVGNLNQVGGRQIDDVKVYDVDSAPDLPMVSTNDSSFARGAIGRKIRAAFPDPSPYEQRS